MPMTIKAIPIPLFIIFPFFNFLFVFYFYFSIACNLVNQPKKRACEHPCQNQKNNHANGDNISNRLDAALSKFLMRIKILNSFHFWWCFGQMCATRQKHHSDFWRVLAPPSVFPGATSSRQKESRPVAARTLKCWQE